MIKESTLSHQDIIYFQIWVNRLMIQENWTWYRSNMYYVYARYIFCKKSAGISFVAFKNWPENRTATWLIQLLVMGKVIYPKYSKHWPYNVASIIDCGCSKMLNHGSWFKSWVFPFTFQAYTLPHKLNCMCVPLFKFHILILKQF